MKTFHLVFCLSCILLTSLTKAETSAQRVASLIESADHAVIRQDIKPKDEKTVVISDAAWIRNVAAAIASAQLDRSDHCLCIGYRMAYFYVGEKQVASVAAIHGKQLRLSWTGGRGDFPVDESTWKAVAAALVVPQESVPAAPTDKSISPVQAPQT